MFSGRVGIHGMARRHCRPASHTPLHSPWLSLPPSISSSLRSCPPGHPVLPFPTPIQMLADAEGYLQPPKASARDVKGVTQIGPGACGWWAQGEPGLGQGEVRSGVPRACWDSQLLPRHSSFSTSSPLPCSEDRIRSQTLKFKTRKNKKKARERSPDEHCSTPLPAIPLHPAAAPSSPPSRSPCLFRYPGKHFVLR